MPKNLSALMANSPFPVNALNASQGLLNAYYVPCPIMGSGKQYADYTHSLPLRDFPI